MKSSFQANHSNMQDIQESYGDKRGRNIKLISQPQAEVLGSAWGYELYVGVDQMNSNSYTHYN